MAACPAAERERNASPTFWKKYRIDPMVSSCPLLFSRKRAPLSLCRKKSLNEVMRTFSSSQTFSPFIIMESTSSEPAPRPSEDEGHHASSRIIHVMAAESRLFTRCVKPSASRC